MNKLKALLIAGLLSLSSVSFATSISYSAAYLSSDGSVVNDATRTETVADGTQAGTIYLDNDGIAQGFNGQLVASTASTTSAWYELILGSGDTNNLITFGWAYNTAQPNDLKMSFLDSVGNSLGAGFTDLMGNFSVVLAGDTTYRMLLSGSQDRSYDGEISAVPVPAAGILFASALLGAGVFGRRKKKSAKTSMVGAFARAS